MRQLVLLAKFRKTTLKGCHNQIDHLGLKGMLNLMCNHFFQPWMAVQVKEHVQKCHQCVTFKVKQQRFPMENIAATQPWSTCMNERWGLDQKRQATFRKMWFLINREKKTNYTHSFCKLGALLKHTGVWSIFCHSLKLSIPQKCNVINPSLWKFLNGICLEQRCQDCMCFIMWSSGTLGMQCTISKWCSMAPSHVTDWLLLFFFLECATGTKDGEARRDGRQEENGGRTGGEDDCWV